MRQHAAEARALCLLVSFLVRWALNQVPMLGIWFASLGGALHAPVTTYFQVELGASTVEIGNFGVIRTAGVLLVSPLYGWLLDRHSAYTPAAGHPSLAFRQTARCSAPFAAPSAASSKALPRTCRNSTWPPLCWPLAL